MSWQLDQERGIKPKIDMPPIVEQAEEIQHEQQEQPIIEQQVQQVEETIEEVETAPEPAPKVETKKENDLRRLREKAERTDKAERERDELYRRLQEAENKQQTRKVEEPEPDYNINPDDLVEGKHLSKYDKKIKKLQEELESYKQQSSFTNIESRLKSKYPDIDSVVSRENLETLRANYPELAESVNSNTDLYNKAASAYTLIKKLGIVTEDVYVEDKIKAQKNAAKPRPLTSVSPQQGDSPLSHANAFANGLTDELKARLRKEMEDARRAM